MQRIDVFKRLRMNEFYWGSVFDITPLDQDISTNETRISLLDRICKKENLNALGTGWNQLTFNQAQDLLTKALTFDLAYTSSKKTSNDKIDFFLNEILRGIDDQAIYCYTNWVGNPWNTVKAGSWNPLTKNTFDIGIVFLTNDRLIFTGTWHSHTHSHIQRFVKLWSYLFAVILHRPVPAVGQPLKRNRVNKNRALSHSQASHSCPAPGTDLFWKAYLAVFTYRRNY